LDREPLGPEDIAKLMPEEYALGNLTILFKRADVGLKRCIRFLTGIARRARSHRYAVLKAVDPAVAGATFDLFEEPTTKPS